MQPLIIVYFEEVRGMRNDGRELNALRCVHIETNYLKHPEGSVLITCWGNKGDLYRKYRGASAAFYAGARKRLDYG